ncbi:TRAP transporter substrate-binding protein [Halovulum sp. GXIMD14793]
MKRILTAATVTAAALTAPAQADTYDLQSTFPLAIPSIGPSPGLWADKVRLMTGGEVDITVHGAGDFVPGFEVFGAVSSGALPMGFDWIGYWSGTIPVANLVGAMPFGPPPEVFLGWMFEGGGLEIIQKAYDEHNVKIIPCHLVLPEAGGWYHDEINSVEDLKGKNIRIAGLGGKTLAKLGANPQIVPAGEIYVALETGRLDAAEFSVPQIDVNLGFHKIVKNYYFPGWHQPASWDSIIINMDVWNGFSEQNQTIMIEACKANITENLIDQIHNQADPIAKMEAEGATVRRFPDDVLAALKAASIEVMEEEAANDPYFKEAYESLTAYIAAQGRWSALQQLDR